VKKLNDNRVMELENRVKELNLILDDYDHGITEGIKRRKELEAKIQVMERVVKASKARQEFYLKYPKWTDAHPRFETQLKDILQEEMDALALLDERGEKDEK